MRAFRKCSRILILCLLCVSIFVPVFLLSFRLKQINSDGECFFSSFFVRI